MRSGGDLVGFSDCVSQEHDLGMSILILSNLIDRQQIEDPQNSPHALSLIAQIPNLPDASRTVLLAHTIRTHYGESGLIGPLVAL